MPRLKKNEWYCVDFDGYTHDQFDDVGVVDIFKKELKESIIPVEDLIVYMQGTGHVSLPLLTDSEGNIWIPTVNAFKTKKALKDAALTVVSKLDIILSYRYWG